MTVKETIINEMDFEFGKDGVTGFEGGKGYKPNQFSKYQMEDKTAVVKYLQKKGLFSKVATKNDVSSLDIVKRVDGFIVNFDDGGSLKIPNSALGLASADTEEDEAVGEAVKEKTYFPY